MNPKTIQATATLEPSKPSLRGGLAVRTDVRAGDPAAPLSDTTKSMHDMQMTPVRNLRG